MVIKTEQIKQIKDFFTLRREVAAVLLYGSQADSKATPLSDVDLAVLVDESLSQSQRVKMQLTYINQVEKILEEDLSADVKILNDNHSLFYLAKVINTGKPLVINQPDMYRLFIENVSRLYPDYYYMLNHYQQRVLDRLEEGTYAS